MTLRNLSHGMRRYSGFVIDDYRIEVKIPTTLFDPQKANIAVYDFKKGDLITNRWFELKQMPRWDIPLQAIILCKRDERKLEKITNEMLRFLRIDI